MTDDHPVSLGFARGVTLPCGYLIMTALLHALISPVFALNFFVAMVFSSQWYPIWSPFYMMALSLPCCSLQPVSLWPICQRGMFVSSFGSAVAAWFGSVALRFLRGLSTLSLLAGGDVHFKACQSPPHLIFHLDWTRCQLCVFLLNPLNPKP